MGDIGFDGLTIGERVAAAIRDKGYKVEDVAFALDLTTGHVRKLMRGEHDWKEDHLIAAATFLDQDLYYLKTGRRFIGRPEEQMELKERIANDMNSVSQLPAEDRIEHLACILEIAAKIMRQ